MNAGQICIRGVETARKNESVHSVARRMKRLNIGALVVVDHVEAPIGIVTDRDLILKVIAENKDPERTDIGDVMSERVTAVHMEMPIERVLEVMRSGPYRRVPVIDLTARLIGLLSIDDILSELAAEFRAVSTNEVNELIK